MGKTAARRRENCRVTWKKLWWAKYQPITWFGAFARLWLHPWVSEHVVTTTNVASNYLVNRGSAEYSCMRIANRVPFPLTSRFQGTEECFEGIKRWNGEIAGRLLWYTTDNLPWPLGADTFIKMKYEMSNWEDCFNTLAAALFVGYCRPLAFLQLKPQSTV